MDSTGWGPAPEDIPGTPEFNMHEDYLQKTQSEIDRVNRSILPEPGGYPIGGARRSSRQPTRRAQRPRVFSKWLLLTFPLGFVAALVHVNGLFGHHIPAVAQFFAGAGIAILGSPRSRPAGIVLLVCLIGAAVWVWS